MKKLLIYCCCFNLLLTPAVLAEQSPENSTSDENLWDAVKQTGNLMWYGFGKQFTTKSNLGILGVGAAASWWAFEEDDRISNRYMKGDIANIVDHVGDAGVFFNFPFATAGAWYLGKMKGNKKLQEFSKEVAATTYIVLGESLVLSYIQVHERPNTDNLSKWETDFRGDSSWPSGHIVPYAALFWKTLQFYGPYWSIIPLGLTWLSGRQRLEDGKHYLSDLVSAFFFAGLASEGVRAANGFKENHPFYKWVFEHDARVSLLRHRNAVGPKVSWSF